jgi:hypothetical protein
VLTFSHSLRLLGFVSERLDQLLENKDRPWPRFDPPLDLDGKKGGAFCIFQGGRIILHALIGDIPDEKVKKYWDLAAQKAERLSIFDGHVSSWQSRRPPTHWGGAVRCTEMIFSFSGLPESWDEALMLLTAVDSDSMTRERADIIAGISDNPHWNPIRQAYFV